MSKLDDIAERLKKFDKQKAKLKNDRLRFIKYNSVRCIKCRNASLLSFWTFVQTTFLREPPSFSDGGYRAYSDIENCKIKCPNTKCCHENDISNHPDKDVLIMLIGDEVVTNMSCIFDSVEIHNLY